MSDITLEGVSKTFGDTVAVRDVDLHVAEGEFFSLLGPSGSGKSTVLRMIAGFLEPTRGEIRIGGVPMVGVPSERRDIGYVFQDYALFPHLSVHDNVAFGLRARKVPKREIGDRVEEALELSGLAGYGKRRPSELSGGERQRVAIARALVIRPRVLLLDEPLGALDRLLREQMQFWVKHLQRELGVTTIHVTHDQTEALTMSDRIAIMRRGAVAELGTPRQLYHEPAHRFSAEFMGDNNVLEGGVVADHGATCEVELASGVRVAAAVPARAASAGRLATGRRLVMGIRPEDIELRRDQGDPAPGPRGRIAERVFRGPVVRYRVELPGGLSLAVDAHGRDAGFDVGDAVVATWPADRCTVLLDRDVHADAPAPQAGAGHVGDELAAATPRQTEV